MPKTELTATVGWEQANWAKLERVVFKLQKRIFQASQRGDTKAVRKLQRTLMKSWSARMLAVRRVTQDNRGKKTAGVDGVKSIAPKQRLALVHRLRRLDRSYKAKPVRRVWIDKPGKPEKRPLGIPTMHDRAAQALIKAALEPEWEAKFEANSFGFRPGRSCHDAIEAIFSGVRLKSKYVLDADIAQCFDKIDHEALLRKLNTSPTTRRIIKSWLKAGVVDWNTYAKRKEYSQTLEGTPQGGVISPLLANIALHGLETRIKQAFPKLLRHQRETWFHKKGEHFNSPIVVRYADDFVILHEDLAVVQKCQQITADWLTDMGLELKSTKTRLSHTLTPTSEGNVGFDFLGFHVRQHEVGEYRSQRGFKTIITPSKAALIKHTQKVGSIIEQHKNAPKAVLIARLNPVIRGWCNYHKSQCSKAIFSQADFITYQQLRGWAVYRHKYKNRVRKEWIQVGSRTWTFATNDGHRLIRHSDTKVVRHTKVEGVRSPYDGDWAYWSTRRGTYPGVKKQISQLIQRNGGKCDHCGHYFSPDDNLEIHHKDKNHNNNKVENLTLVHGHCHDYLHSRVYKNLQSTRELSAMEEWIDDHPF